MTNDEIDAATVARGLWHYHEAVDMSVRIIGIPFDYWYAMGEANEQLEEGEEPEAMGELGLLYYPYFTQIDGPGFPTIIQAKGFAPIEGAVRNHWI